MRGEGKEGHNMILPSSPAGFHLAEAWPDPLRPGAWERDRELVRRHPHLLKRGPQPPNQVGLDLREHLLTAFRSVLLSADKPREAA